VSCPRPSAVGLGVGILGPTPRAVLPARLCVDSDALVLDAFQTDCRVVDHICARSKQSLTFRRLTDKSCSGDNSRSLMSCLSKTHMTLRRVRTSCGSGPRFRPSRPRLMAWLSRTCMAACISLTSNSSPSQAGSYTLVGEYRTWSRGAGTL
jgi:hypothetical protein